MRRFVTPAAALLAQLVFCSTAYGAMAYNYGINWAREPFWDQDGSNPSRIAAKYQSQRGYQTAAYSDAWASDVWSNMQNVSVMNIACTHGEPGVASFYRATPRLMMVGGAWYTSHVSILTANFDRTGWFTLGNVQEPINHFRRLDRMSANPMRITLYQCCNSARAPGGGWQDLTWESVVKGSDFAGGFTGNIGAFDINGYPIQDRWSHSYWWSCANGYYTDYAMERAQIAVQSMFGGPCGYDTHLSQGNRNLRL